MKGIYKIICVETNTTYIGSTTVCFKKRFQKHRQRLRYNYHENEYLQNAWNKYGEDKFVFEILEDLSNETNEKIKEREAYWLNEYFPKGREFCFNLSDHTDGGNTLKTDEIKKKHSQAVKNSYTSELRQKRKEQIASRSEELKEKFKQSRSTDKWKEAHLAGVRKLAKDPTWIEKLKKANEHRRVAVHTDKGEYFESISDAAKKLNINRANIRSSLNGRYSQCAGRKWFYTNK